jgi:hypothetical protein
MNFSSKRVQSLGSLRKWGQALKDEGNPLGESLLAYADAWQAQVQEMAQEIRDTARSCHDEARWQASQGDEYGSY